MLRPVPNHLTLLAMLTIPAVAVRAQQPVFEKLEIRVTAAPTAGIVTIDRGERDRVAAGDKVVLLPRNGDILHGTVTKVGSRSATVELVDRSAQLRRGVRGEVLVPRQRRRPGANAPVPVPEGPKATKPKQPATGAEAGQPTTNPTRRRPRQGRTPREDGWRPGMPLLAGSRPLEPRERASRTTGRIYTAGDLRRTLDSFDQSFARLGTDFEVENPVGYGGTLRVHAEFTYLTETTGNTDPDLRVFELAYEIGGTRYDPMRWQFGRLLPRDMPEFGLLDGVEWGYRFADGHRIGASFGALPELDEDLDTGADMQLAAWYLWPDTIAERLTFGVGYQKTWHHLRADRDLVVGKVRYLPSDGWDIAATTWVDFYYGSDTKRDGPELTRARAHATRRWDGGSGLEFTYDHEEYPDQRRTEFLQTIQPATLLDAHQDRFGAHAFTTSSSGTRWFARGTAWTDQDRTGATAEAGLLADDLLVNDMRSGLAGFLVHGAHSTLLGGRIDHGGQAFDGRLDALLEIAFVHHEGFPDNADDLIQYRLAGHWSRNVGERWNLLCYGDATLWDTELSLGLGFYLQRTF